MCTKMKSEETAQELTLNQTSINNNEADRMHTWQGQSKINKSRINAML